MNQKSILPLLLVSAALLAGCEKKKEAPAAPARPVVTAPAAAAKPQPTAAEQVKQTATEVVDATKEAGEKALASTKAAAKEVGEDAKTAAANLATEAKAAATSATDAVKEVTKDVKTETQSFLNQLKTPAAPATTAAASGTTTAASADAAGIDVQALIGKVTESAKGLLDDSSVTTAVKEQLKKLSDSVLSGDDAEATSALSKIVALKPSDSQMATVKELQSNLGVLVLGRDFDVNDPASGGAVRQTIEAIKAKDTAAAVSGLQKIYSTAKPTDAQKQLVTNLLSSYNGKLAGVSDAVEKAGSTLKSFGF